MEAHQRTVDEALQEQHSSRSGLCDTQVQERSRVYGLNKLQEEKKASLLKRLAKQLSDSMIIVLLGAALISGITSAYAHESYADTFIILFVVMVNAILGLYQEGKAEAAIEALKDMNAPACKVMRNGEIRVTASEDLVPGDVVVLEAGDAVPADGRVLECASLKVEESALTGESLPVEKQTDALQEDNPPLGDRRNMVYMGSSVVYGRGRVLITATGMHTEMGKIADAILVSREEATPLQQKLNRLSKILSFLVLAICVFMFLFELLNSSDLRPEALLDTFMLAVSLAVAAIPEGLAAVVTVQLAIGVTRRAKRNAVIRQLTAVETLGCTQVICSDKTGTLTQNCMRVVEHAGDDEYLLALAMSLCNDTQVHADGTLQGEPTEMALSAYGETLFHVNEEIRKYPRIHEYPFDSQRKMMTTMHRESDGVVLQFTKGAMDVVLQRCTGIWRNKKIEPMREEDREALQQMNKQMADQALRELCAACKWSDHMELDMETAESDLVFLGLCGMMDPVREEVKPAIAQCRQAGIRPVMITGDHIDTAAAIAKSLHIITDSSQAMSGSTLDTLSQEELIDRVEQTFVYARVKPEHKVRIVDAWKSRGYVVAMSGDGVNDAPAIKRASIGVGMGITGTDVTKNVADMVLADDNFATIVSAVKEGRKIYDNIRKAIQFLLSSNISEVLSIFLATMMGFTILKPVHILWVNLLTDTFPALALGMEEGDADLMRRPPRPSSEGLFANGLHIQIIFQGCVITLITFLSYIVGHYMEAGVWEITQSADGMTMAFLTMSMTEMFHAFNMRSLRQSVVHMKKQNWYLIASVACALMLTIAVIYIPVLSRLFEFEHISIIEFAVALIMSASIIPIVEIEKWVHRAAQRKQG